MKRCLFILAFFLPFLLRAQLVMYENRPAVGPNGSSGDGTSGLGYLTNGLVEWNKFNDHAGATIAADASGNSNSMPLIGSPTLTGSYLALNGTTQYADAGSNQLLALDYHDLTICAWINKTGSSYKGIVDKSFYIPGAGGGGWGFWILTNNYLDFWVESGEDMPDKGSEAVPLGQWTFVSVVYNYSGHEADFYINGVLTSKSANGGASQSGSSLADLEIGNLQNNAAGGAYAFDGGIHDVAIYNRALSAAEIATNYLNTVSSTNTFYPDLLYYKMTEYAQTNFPVYLADSSFHSNTTGTVLFNPTSTLQWVSNVAGIPQTAIAFDGESTYIDTSNSLLFNFTNNLFTVNFWIALRSANSCLLQNGIFENSGWSIKLGGDYQIYLTTEANGVESAVGTGTGAVQTGDYSMVTVVRTGPTTAAVYVNGVPVSTTGSISDPAPSTNTLVIGRDQTGGNYYIGNLWLMQIWSQPLTAGAIADLYLHQLSGYPWPGVAITNTYTLTNTNTTTGTNGNGSGGTTNTNGTGGTTNCVYCGGMNTNSAVSSNAFYLPNGLVEWNPFNDAPGTTTAVDASGNGNTMPLIGAPVLNGSYVTLNGTNQYGDAGNHQLTSLDNGDITICAWINKAGNSYKGIVDKHYSVNGGYGGWGFWVLASGQLDWWLEDNYQYIDGGGEVLIPGQWTFVTAVYHKAAHDTDFYYNGLWNSTTGTGAASQQSSAGANLEIGNLGNNQSNGLYAFDGFIQHLGIYNRALSGSEVQSNFQNSEVTTNVSIPDLLYYKMTEYPHTNIPVYLADSSIHGGTTGTVHSGYSLQWITNAANVPNAAMHFNGVSTYIDTSNSTLFNFTTNLFTINLWLCPLTANGYIMQNGIDNQSGWVLRVGGSYQLYFGAEGNGGESVVGTGPGAANVNHTTMVTLVRTGPTTVLIYLNGVQTATTGSFANPVSSTGSLIFGTGKSGGNFLDGNIWLPQIWSRPLTPVEIANLYLTQSIGSPWP